MRKTTPLEYQRSIKLAQRDLEILAKICKDLKVKNLSNDNFQFLVSMFPPPMEVAKHTQTLYLHWGKCIDKEIGRIQSSIDKIQEYLKSIQGKPHRCAIPKREQRRLGLLPPV